MFEQRKESSSPYINRFLSADTIVPGYANPQNLNRYSYVTNNPLRYTDPTGHIRVDDEGGGGNKGCSDPRYCSNGKPKSDEELKKMRNEKKKGGGSLMTIVPPGPCSGQTCSIVEVSVSPLPYTLTYHPLSGDNLVYDLPMYDNSYYPPKLIGHQMKFYTMDSGHFDPLKFVIPSDPLTAADTIQTAGKGLRWLGERSLGGLSKLLAPATLPALGNLLSLAAGIDSLNSAITIDGHLESEIYYFSQSPVNTPFNTPFDPRKIP